MVFDDRQRLHAVFALREGDGIRANGVIVLDQPMETIMGCQTVNALDDTYPFRVQDKDGLDESPSPSVRSIAAGGGDIWLFASDGGVARVIDSLQTGDCGVETEYPEFFSRQNGVEGNRLLTNTVPAFVAAGDGALWFGTALGLMRRQAGQFTPLRFDPALSIETEQFSQDMLDTLESFIGRLATAISESRPVESEMIGDVSFLDFFGQALVKEDFIFSAVEDSQHRLWVGTLGGGIRRIEAMGTAFMDTLHITRSGVTVLDPATNTRRPVESRGQLVSNVIFALATDSDGDVWAATDKGVSHIQEQADRAVVITSYTALDGLALPVRDVLVSNFGDVWLATDRGVFKLTSESIQLQGLVIEAGDQVSLSNAVEGADVIIQTTPFRAVTDADGAFSLPQLPLRSSIVQVRADHAIGGPFTQAFAALMPDTASPTAQQFIVVRRGPLQIVDPIRDEFINFENIPGSEMILAPADRESLTEIGLTILPLETLDSLPLEASSEGIATVLAAEFQPNDVTFTQSFTLTLPSPTPLPPGIATILSCLETTNNILRLSPAGSGQVNQDGRTSTVTSFKTLAVTDCPILGFQVFCSQLGSMGPPRAQESCSPP